MDVDNLEYRNKFEYEVHSSLKKNTILSILDGAIYAMGMGMAPVGTVLIYFISQFTDSNILIGLLSTLHGFLFFTPQILIGKRVQALKYYKPLSMKISIIVRLFWLILAIFTFLIAKPYPNLYLFLFFITIGLLGLFSGFNSNVWLVLTARIIPSNKLSNFLSIRASVSGLLETTGAYLGGIILTFCTFPYNYGILFLCVFIVVTLSLGVYSMIEEPKDVLEQPVDMDNRGYFKRLMEILKADKNFQAYLLSTAFVGGLGKMSLAFQVVYAKGKLSITAGDVAIMSTILLFTQTVGYIIWGIVVNKKGVKLAGTLSGILFIPAIVLTLWIPNVWVLYVAVTFMSFAQSYRNSNENKLVINLCPSKEVLPCYIGLRNSLMGPFFSLNSLLAGFILDMTNFAVLTVISLVFMVSGMLVFAFRLKVPEIE